MHLVHGVHPTFRPLANADEKIKLPESIAKKKGDVAKGDIPRNDCDEVRDYMAAPEAAPCIFTSTFSVRPS